MRGKWNRENKESYKEKGRGAGNAASGNQKGNEGR